MLSLAFAILVIFLTLTLPGALFNLSATKDVVKAVCLAPLTTIALLSIATLIYSRIGIWTDYRTLVVCVGAVATFALGVSILINKSKSQNHFQLNTEEFCCLAVFGIIAAILTATVFLIVLDGPDCYFQAWDNQTHLRRIRAFTETGNFSPFNNQLYSDSSVAPNQSINTFYPSAWHLLAAMLVSLLNIPVTEAANAINILSVGLLLPMTMFLCLREMGIAKPASYALCAVICIGVPIYPWDLISYGPLYPNLLGFCVLPGEIALLLNMLNSIDSKKPNELLGTLLLLLLGTISLALVHPNCVFALGLILAPYLISKVKNLIKTSYQKLPDILCAAVPLFAIALIWITLNRMSFMHGVVDCYWPAFTTVKQAFLNSLFLGTTTHPIQLFIPILVFAGIYTDIKDNKFCLVATYVLLVLFYTIDAGTNLAIKPILTGFWYNDYHRISAMLGLVSILLACKAINRTVLLLEKTCRIRNTCKRVAITGAAVISASLIIFWSFIPLQGSKEWQTAFGYQITEMRYQYSKQLIYYDIFSPLEEEFCKTTLPQFNPDNSAVINNPDDGSLFAYSVYGLNMYYRTWYPPSTKTETKESLAIRYHLNELKTNKTVRNAVEKIGAKYVLQLDHGDQTQEYRIQYNNDNAEEWRGIDLIDESTPGFSLVAANDDIRLYRIDLD